MANEKLVNRENLKAFRKANDKRYEDGVVVVGKSLTTTQIDNVNEDSGTTQTNPFVFQATATDGGTGASDTSPVAKYIELQGKTYCLNQQLPIPTNSKTTTINQVSLTDNRDGSFTLNGTASALAEFNTILTDIPIINGHKYLLKGNTTFSSSFYLRIAGLGNDEGSGTILTATSSTTSATMKFVVENGITVNNVKIIPQLIDLTQLFNGNIPTAITSGVSFADYNLSFSGIDIFNQLFPLPYYAYNTGTLVSANATTLKTIGKNQFDGTWKSSGVDYEVSDYIRVIPKQKYMLSQKPSGYTMRYVYEYDGNFNQIALTTRGINSTTTNTKNPITNSSELVVNLESNTQYVVIRYDFSTAPQEIQFYIAWLENGTTSRPDYEEYVEHTYDLGSELETIPLLSAGSVYDYKEPNGTIHRLVGVSLLENMGFTYDSGNTRWYSTSLQGTIKNVSSNADVGNIICSNLPRDSVNNAYTNPTIPSISVSNNGTIYIYGLSSSATIAGTLFYELATPTTEQGTPFADNVVVDDFGTMEYGGTNFNGFPQGCQFFYQADYVLFIDTLGNSAEWDGSKIALKSDLSGLVKQDDVSSKITKNATSLVNNFVKVYQTGKIINLFISAYCSSGAGVSIGTTLYTLDSSIKPIGNFNIPVSIGNPSTVGNIRIENGVITCDTAIPYDTSIYITISWVIA